MPSDLTIKFNLGKTLWFLALYIFFISACNQPRLGFIFISSIRLYKNKFIIYLTVLTKTSFEYRIICTFRRLFEIGVVRLFYFIHFKKLLWIDIILYAWEVKARCLHLLFRLDLRIAVSIWVAFIKNEKAGLWRSE